MQAQRLILETDQYGHFIQQPQLPANTKVEVIFLFTEEQPQKTFKRKPSAKLGKMRMNAAIEPVVTEAEIEGFMTRTAQQIAGINTAFE